MLQSNDHVLEYVDSYLHDVLTPSEDEYVQKHCEQCRICAVALEEAEKRQTAFQAVPGCEAAEGLIQGTLQTIDDSIERQARHRRLLRRAVLPGLAACVAILGGLNLYYLNLSPSPYDLTLFGQAKLWADSDASLRVRVLHHEKNAGVEGVPVAIDLLDPKAGEVVHLASFTTDSAGTGKPRFRLPDWPDGDYNLRVTARLGGTITRTVQLRRAWKLMLSSDRPVYQPGQTIHMRALTLNRMSLRPVAGKEAVFTVRDPKGNVIFKQKDLTSKFGICAVDCPLADGIIEGTYLLRCALGDTESKLQVEVKKYVLPKFKVEITTAQPWYQAGQRVSGKIKATYFFGKPVAGAAVELVELLGGNSGGLKLETLTVKTNESGEASFEFLPFLDDISGPVKDVGRARIELRAAVVDSASQKQTKRLSLAVAAQPLRIEVLPESGRLIADLPNIIYVLVSTPDGKPVKARVLVSGLNKELVTSDLGVASFEFKPAWGQDANWTVKAIDARGQTSRQEVTVGHGNSSDFIFRPDRAVYTAGNTVRLLALGHGNEPVLVDFVKEGQTILTETIVMSNGRGECQIDLPPEWFGNVQLFAHRLHFRDDDIHKTRSIYIKPPRHIEIRTNLDKGEYRPGNQARLEFEMLGGRGEPTPGALSLSAVDDAVFSVLQQLPATELVFSDAAFDLPPSIAFFSTRPTGGENKKIVAERDNALFARTVATFAATRNNEDEGARAENGLDASTHRLNVMDFQKARASALIAIKIGWLLLGCAFALVFYFAMWCFLKPRAILVIHIMGFIAFVISTGTQGDLGNSLLSVKTPSAEGRAAQFAGQPAREVAMGEATIGGFKDGTSNGMVLEDRYATVLDHSGSMNLPQSPPRVRDWFPETLLWRPELITDDHGRASLDLDLADSITTWRLTASAVTADGRLGASQSSIKVFQPFFVDINLPVALTRHDEIAVPVVLYNYLDEPQVVELRLDKTRFDKTRPDRLRFAESKLAESRLGKSGCFTCLDEPVQRIKLKPREVRGTFYRIRAEKVGRHQLQVTAFGSGMSDAIKRQVEVVPDGRRIEAVWNGVVDAGLTAPARHAFKLPAHAIEGSPQMFVKIYPSTFSQLVEGLDAIFQAPYGCFEQTSSTTYPNVLALNYLRRTKKSVPAVEAKAKQYIHLGYQRLLSFEVLGGGFDWFGKPPANRTLTAYGLMEFEDMARVHEVDPNLIERTRRWLLEQRQPDGSWQPERHVHENLTGASEGSPQARLSATAYIAWSVFRGQRSEAAATRSFLLSHRAETIADPHVLGLVANALLAIDPNSSDALPYLDRLEAMKATSADGKLCWWQQDASYRTTFYGSGRSGSVETTALAALAFMQGHQHPATVQRALAWLVQQKDASGTWPSTQATVLALKALLTGTSETLGSGERRIELTLNGKKRTLTIPADQVEVMKLVDLTADLLPGEQTLNLAALTGAAGYQVVFRYHEPGEADHQDTPLSIQVVYDKNKLHVGDRLQAMAKIVNHMKETAPMVLVQLPIPAGFTADAGEFQRLVENKTIAKYQVQPRAVQVYLRGLDKELAITYHLDARMAVDVQVPAARVYEYYNPDRQGHSASSRLKVMPALLGASR